MWANLFVFGSFVAAMYLFSQRPDGADLPHWNEGYKAGWLTPGPYTIIALLGMGSYTFLIFGSVIGSLAILLMIYGFFLVRANRGY